MQLNFTNVANERPAPVFSHNISDDLIFFGGILSFDDPEVLVRIKSTNPAYEWMGNNDPDPQDTPANAVFGVFSQALPIIPWASPFFMKKQGRLQMQWTNSAAAITGGEVTLHGLRLTDPINGVGWDYSLGLV